MNKGLKDKQPSLFSAIAIGVGCIIGSGWLFAAYYASRCAGPASLISWVIGAVLALILALLLAEITTMYKDRGLFSRLLTITHNNKDFGFIIALSNWIGLLIVIPSEATATIQYLSSAVPKFSPFLMHNEHLTLLGVFFVICLIIIYGLINYWGFKGLTAINNIITSFKFIVPLFTGILLIIVAFNGNNFTAYKGSFMPYGLGSIFSAVVQSGIFYAYYGFSTIAIFGAELKNPKRNIPLALVGSVLVCLVIYLVLQIAFIGAIPADMISNGWHTVDFTSPLAQLLILVNLNVWSIFLYVDAVISPSGTGIVYSGSATRMLTGMASDAQMPLYFDRVHPIFNLSRRSLVASMIISIIVVLFFREWRSIIIMVTAVQLIGCIAVPVAFTKLRISQPNKKRLFRFKGGSLASPCLYVLLTYLMVQAGSEALISTFIISSLFFLLYAFSYYHHNMKAIGCAFLSAWTMFAYLIIVIILALISEHKLLSDVVFYTTLVVTACIMFVLMILQKDYNCSDDVTPQ
ncbi:MAG: APC family permease [Endozoicomonadaceae bacterium]|nr:APC family permease [Endozoicomonadaceae bacterium]MCY4329292.1 APC family permease [Endozoicomonadaceae bacterium]